MGTHRLLTVLALGLLCFCPRSTFGAAQLKAGAATSAQPTAPKGTSLRQLQIQFDPATFSPSATTQPTNDVDFTRAVESFQLTVGYNSSQVRLLNLYTPDYSNTNFGPPSGFSESFYPALYGPYDPNGTFTGTSVAALFIPSPLSTAIPTGFDTFVTAGGSIVGPLVAGDVNIFSLLFDVAPNVTDAELVKFAIFASPHTTDGTPLNPDFITSVSLTDPNDFTDNGPGMVETTIIGVSLNGNFVTFQGNSALAPAAVVPLPPAAMAGLLGLAVAAVCGLWSHRKPQSA